MKFRFATKNDINLLPKSPGVYAFKKKQRFLYIGKAINLRERIKQHLKQFAKFTHSSTLGYYKTSSEIEALILESNLIKKYRPKYNVLWRDDKNYFYVAITKEKLPRVFITHQTKLYPKPHTLNPKYIGPFVEGKALKQALKYLRRAFPYYSAKKHPKTKCLWCYLNLCPGSNPVQKKYQKDIKNLIKVLEGKRKYVLLDLKKAMIKASRKQDFEKAARFRDQIRALEKVFTHAKIFQDRTDLEVNLSNYSKTEKVLKSIMNVQRPIKRIEAYDVSNIQGQKATGSMVVFIKGKPAKNFYRKFKIKVSDKPNDVAMLKETLSRRLRHPEWGWPDLILIDGGKAQLNAALDIINRHKSVKSASIKVLALAKRKNELFIENQNQPVLLKRLSKGVSNLILHLRDEAHRFAITYHRKLRKLDLLRGL